jgi:hypothetical protein
MGALIIVVGIIYIGYNLIKEACEPTQTRPFDWEAYNKEVSSHKYTSKQISKMMDQGKWRK